MKGQQVGRFFLFAGILLLLASCGIFRDEDNIDTPAIEGATPESSREFEFQGVSLLYDPTTVQQITAAFRVPTTDYGGVVAQPVPIEGVPDFARIRLQTVHGEAAVGVQLLRDKQADYFIGYDTALPYFTALENDLDNRSGQISTLPYGNNRTNIAQLQYLNFNNGRGRRMIFFSSTVPESTPLPERPLYYLFEGVSTDGRYLVWLLYPVQAALLAEELDPATTVDMALATLNSEAVERFTPSLTHLDNLAMSLTLNLTESRINAVAIGATGGSPFNLCAAGEQVFFSCQMAGSDRMISVCGSSDLSVASGSLFYREGVSREDPNLLTWPEAGTDPADSFTFSSITRPSVTFLQLGFAMPTADIVLFDDFYGEVGVPQTAAGIQTTPTAADSNSEIQFCGSNVVHNLASLASVLPNEQFTAVSDLAAANQTAPTLQFTATGNTYVVRSGDNLYRIGLAHGVNWVAIANANNIPWPYHIQPGQVLIIPR